MLNIEYIEKLNEEFYKKCRFEVDFIIEDKENLKFNRCFLWNILSKLIKLKA